MPVAPGSPQLGVSHISFVRRPNSAGKGRSSTVSGMSSTPTMIPTSLTSSPLSTSGSVSPPTFPFAESLGGLGSKKRSFRRARGVESLTDYSTMSREELEVWCQQLQEENLNLLTQLKAAEKQLSVYTSGPTNTTGVGVGVGTGAGSSFGVSSGCHPR